MPVELIPAIDLRGGQVVRLTRGDYNQQTTYAVDPVDVAKEFENAGCQWLHVVDLDGAKEGRPTNLATIEKIVQHCKMNVEVGGGIRSEESMEYLLAIGVQRLILGTRALADMNWFESMVNDSRFRDRLVLGLDARDGRMATHGWTRTREDAPTALEVARQVDAWPLAAIIYTDIARDGTLKGPNIESTKTLSEALKRTPLIHSGGVGSLADIQELKALNISGIIVGKALYEGNLRAADAVQALR